MTQPSRRQLDIPSRGSSQPSLIINRHTHISLHPQVASMAPPPSQEFDIVEEIAAPVITTKLVTTGPIPQAPSPRNNGVRQVFLTGQNISGLDIDIDYSVLIQRELQGARRPDVHKALSKTAYKASKLSDSLVTHIPVTDSSSRRKNSARPKRHTFVPRMVAYAVILAVIVGTSYLGIDVWSTNNQLKSELSATAAALGSPNPSARQKSEGRDESDVSSKLIKEYTVAPSMPRTVTVKKAGIFARVLPMDVNPDNSVQAPVNIFDAGWYTGSAKPGEPGAALIDGHASGTTRQGEFANLDLVQVGDIVEVERGDGQVLTYEVVHTEVMAVKDVDMTKLLLPYGENAQGLNLITCTGKFIKNKDGSFTYDHRALVYAKRVS